MTSPARRHFQRVTAAREAAGAGSEPMTGDTYQLMQASLMEDRRRLKDIQSIERKIEVKRELLPKYDDYVTGVLESGQGAQDDVLMTCMVWEFDVGALPAGLEVAEYALAHDLTPPDHYERGTAAIVAEEVATEALRQLGGEDADAESLVPLLERARDLTEGADMHDQIRAKLHKASGYALWGAGRGEDALEHLQRALALDEKVGVKKDIEKLTRDLKNAGGQSEG
jgi:tetratricopeptide (TPR) repeat protein